MRFAGVGWCETESVYFSKLEVLCCHCMAWFVSLVATFLFLMALTTYHCNHCGLFNSKHVGSFYHKCKDVSASEQSKKVLRVRVHTPYSDEDQKTAGSCSEHLRPDIPHCLVRASDYKDALSGEIRRWTQKKRRGPKTRFCEAKSQLVAPTKTGLDNISRRQLEQMSIGQIAQHIDGPHDVSDWICRITDVLRSDVRHNNFAFQNDLIWKLLEMLVQTGKQSQDVFTVRCDGVISVCNEKK